MDKSDLILEKLNNIEKKLEALEEKINNIDKTSNKLDKHIDEINNIYSNYKAPLDYITYKFNSLISWKPNILK
jgi:peptidoglycan hydrolase CwlO-like protein